jgi:hypothetical protein
MEKQASLHPRSRWLRMAGTQGNATYDETTP